MRCHCVDFAAPNSVAADLQAEDLLIHRAGWRFGLEMFVAGELSGICVSCCLSGQCWFVGSAAGIGSQLPVRLGAVEARGVWFELWSAPLWRSDWC